MKLRQPSFVNQSLGRIVRPSRFGQVSSRGVAHSLGRKDLISTASQKHGRPSSVICRAAAATAAAPEVVSRTKFEAGPLEVSTVKLPNGDFEVTISTDFPRPMNLHWAVDDWSPPDMSLVPSGTFKVDDKAVQTPFQEGRYVKLHFPASRCPKRIVFVLKEMQPEFWINNGNFFTVQIRPPSVQDVVGGAVTAEAEYSNWSVLNRFNLANELLDGAESAGAEGMSFLFTWLRLSANRQLDWARKANYQSKDLAWAQKVISSRFAEKVVGAKDPWVRLYARMAMAGLPRGGGNGDDIRMGILNIMRANGIKEGHRPGLDEPFLEQWHQKLHQNTNQDDVVICEAYLAFLHSGNHDDYWRVLWDNGRITKERLEGMNIPIKAWPMHLPHLIPAFKHYLWILKTCHSGADMDTAAEMAKGFLDDGTRWNVFDLLQNRDQWWAAGKVVDIREAMKVSWANSRDVLLLDIALDSFFKTSIERGDWDAAGRDGVLGGIELVLRNAQVSSESEELALCLGLWRKLLEAPDRWSPNWSGIALAVCQRVSLALADYCDQICRHVQPHADVFGARCKIDKAYILNFSEEVVRGLSVFTLSTLMAKVEPEIRKCAGASSWQVISQQASVFGRVLQTASLADIQGKSFSEPTVVFTPQLGGNEDIPEGITAVITRSTTDILSHVAIRARAQGVLLATCFDSGIWDGINHHHQAGTFVSIDVIPNGDVLVSTLEEAAATARIASSSSASSSTSSLPPLQLPQVKSSERFALSDTEFADGVVGAKAKNLAVLGSKGLPATLKVPRSVALPFGSFEKAINHGINQGVRAEYESLIQELESEKKSGSEGIPTALARLRRLVSLSLSAPPELVADLTVKAANVGLKIESDPAGFAPVWKAICGVWASKWNDRAYLSRKARSVPEASLSMSVLLQQVVPARYAFVLHTADALSGARGTTFGEVVMGMGESLVGNAPGRAFGFSGPSSGANHESIGISSLPSKRSVLWCPPEGTLIARSDTNGEDLEAFSGAGLYDSIPVVPFDQRPADYVSEPLLWDGAFSKGLAEKLISAGSAVEAAFGSTSQDIEGVVDASGGITIVQSRPIAIHKI